MAEISQLLFPVAGILVALGFAAHVGHAVMLANGRRALSSLVPNPNRQPAWAGVVTGSFASARASAHSSGPDLAASPTGLDRPAIWLTFGGAALLSVSLLLRASVVASADPLANSHVNPGSGR